MINTETSHLENVIDPLREELIHERVKRVVHRCQIHSLQFGQDL